MSPPTGFLEHPLKALEAGQPWAGLGGDALGFALAHLPAGRWLVVVDGADRARRLARALNALVPERAHVLFLEDDGRPYDGFSRDPLVARSRIQTLTEVDQGGAVCVVATARALMQRIPTREERALSIMEVDSGGTLDRDAFASDLTSRGYLAVERVVAPGTYAIRGDVVDVWAVGELCPWRIDLFDDEVEEIRALDPETLRPGDPVTQVRCLPAREARIDAASVARLHGELGRHCEEQARGVKLRRRVVEELKEGIRFSGVEDYLPALLETEAPMVAFDGFRVVAVFPDDIAAAARDHHQLAQRRYEELEDEERPLVPPTERYVLPDVFLEQLAGAHPVFGLAAEARDAADFQAEPASVMAVRGTELGPAVKRVLALAESDLRVALVVADPGKAEKLLDMLGPHGLHPRPVGHWSEVLSGEVALWTGDLEQGFVCSRSLWALIPVSTLFGVARRTRAQERAHELFTTGLTSTAQLKEGDAIVHRIHGIGRYRGLERLDVGGAAQDYVSLEYHGGDQLYLPATTIDQLSRYTPAHSDAKVRLDRLGGQTWERKKGKVRDHLLKMAQGLLELYARRELATCAPHPQPGDLYHAFEQRFPYQETPDQGAAIDAVVKDLQAPQPMDRLICGDVGFGKTEVAMRAAMKVVEGGRQVAVLCPTTVLAHQHLRTFRDRFAGSPVRVEMLSRFVDAAQQRKTRAALQAGEVDIVVGTHAVLGRAVRFAQLGLIIIDEEHRFGVSQKEKLRKLRAEVDVLSMSATPIPRTLQMALSGVREMSIMATPPRDRLSVRTMVARATESRIRDALQLEHARGGQSYVVHNRVETIDRFAGRLQRWMPDLRFVVAHGQMDADALEQVIVDFVEHRADVLVCTSIVESGIDLPNVNTMLVDRADRFGLSQLYQLRGRVGRSDVRANCLLLVPEDVSRDAQRRLRVLVENTELGSGFRVAAADLEIRGGGNFLGAAQSGHIDQVGYDTWIELLGEAVASARGQSEKARFEPEVEVPVDAFLPESLLPDVPMRLQWYRRLASAHSEREVDALADDLELEVGTLPEEARNLIALSAVRLACRELGVARCSVLKVRVVLEFDPASPVRDAQLESFAKRHPKRIRLVARPPEPPRLEVRFTPQEAKHPLRFLRWVFAQLRAVR